MSKIEQYFDCWTKMIAARRCHNIALWKSKFVRLPRKSPTPQVAEFAALPLPSFGFSAGPGECAPRLTVHFHRWWNFLFRRGAT